MNHSTSKASVMIDELASLYRGASSSATSGAVVYSEDRPTVRQVLRDVVSSLASSPASGPAEAIVVPVYVNMRTVLIDDHAMAWALYFIVQAIGEASSMSTCQEESASVRIPDWEFMQYMPEAAFIRSIRAFQDVFHSRLVLVLDEFTEVLNYEKHLDLDSFTGFFKALIDSAFCSFLLGGDQHFGELLRRYPNHFAICSMLVNMDALACP